MVLKRQFLKNLKSKKSKIFTKIKKGVWVYQRSFFGNRRLINIQFRKVITVIGIVIFLYPMLSKFLTNFQMALYLKNQIINSTYSNEDLLSKYEKKQVDQVVGNYPVRVVIPKLKIDVEVKPSRISEGFWEINKNSANFGIGSALPNQNGNTVIFAHSKKKEFGPLRAIKKDFEVSVQTLDGQWYKYKVVDKKEVKPYEVEYVLPTTEKTLTLFTCTGFADSKRLIVIAK